MVALSLRECEVPRIGVFGGFVIVKFSWEFGIFSIHGISRYFLVQFN